MTGWLGQDGCYRLQVSQDLKFQTIAAECVTEEPQGNVEVGNGFFYARLRWEHGTQVGKWVVKNQSSALVYYVDYEVEDLSKKE